MDLKIAVLCTTLVVVVVRCAASTRREAASFSVFVDPCSAWGSDSNSGTSPGSPLTSIEAGLQLLSGSACDASAAAQPLMLHLARGCRNFLNTSAIVTGGDFSCNDSSVPLEVLGYGSGASVYLSGATRVKPTCDGLLCTAISSSPTDVWRLFAAPNNWSQPTTALSVASLPVLHWDKFMPTKTADTTCFIASSLAPYNLTMRNLRYARVKVYQSWTSSHNPVFSYDPSTHQVCLEGRYSSFPQVCTAGGKRFVIENVLDRPELISPNSYTFEYVANTNWRLAVRLATETSPASEGLYVPQSMTVFSFRGASRVSVRGPIEMAHTVSELSNTCLGGCGQSGAALMVSTVAVSGPASDVVLSNVAVRHTGSYGVWFHEDVHNSAITDSVLEDLGAGGIRVGIGHGGAAKNDSIVASGITVENNIIRDGGHVVEAGCGILLQQAHDCNLTHNTIYDMYYTGVSTGWDWGYQMTSNRNIKVTYNWIYNIGRNRLSDMGCVYNLGYSPGTVVDHNLCHDVRSYNYGGWGLYADQATEDVTFSNNIVYNTHGAGFHHHFGLNNRFVNNIVAHPLALEAGVPNGDSSGIRSSQDSEKQPSSFTAERNIVLLDWMKSIYLFNTVPNAFVNVTMNKNVYWSTAANPDDIPFPPRQHPVTFKEWQKEGKDVDSIIADPLFRWPCHGHIHNYTCLDSNSPAITKMGFVPIDLNGVGAHLLN